MENYYKERNIVNIQRFRKILADLPSFCGQFFIGIENQTSVLTRLNYAYDLRIFFDYLITETEDFPLENQKAFTLSHLNEIKPQHVEQFMSYLNLYIFNGHQSSNNENAKSRKISSIRTLFKYFYTKELLKENVTEKLTLPKIHDKEIVRLEVNEVVNLLDEVEAGILLSKGQKRFHESTKIRDQAIITLFLGTGIRISELVGINITDIDFQSNAFTITRKGGNRTILYFAEEVETALKKYLQVREKNIQAQSSPALFLSLQNNRISTKAVQQLVKKYSKIVTPNKKITPHKLRSTYGTNLYHETKDIYIVADVLGHKDVNTTKKHYAAISDEIRRNAAKAVRLREPDHNNNDKE